MVSLLEEWPRLLPDHALELLDYAYAEPAVRSFAIECLTPMRYAAQFVTLCLCVCVKLTS